MLTLIIPGNFLPERTYIIEVLLGEFLGLDYKIEISDAAVDYKIILENKKELVIKDGFFSKLKNGLSYLVDENIPGKVAFVKNRFAVEKDIPVIYGTDELAVTEKKIVCGIDMFASSFFMLSRWEEYANKTRDRFNRFPLEASLAYKCGFLDRPVVNEYVEMLWNMLRFLGCAQERKNREFQMLLTHDVDVPLLSLRSLIRIFGSRLTRKKFPPLLLSHLLGYFRGRLNVREDPFNTFDKLMNISESFGLRSHFFFQAGKMTRYDSGYSINSGFMRELFAEIDRRGHIIGFHPGFHTYNNGDLWRSEYESLLRVSPQHLECGRQHRLGFEVPTTWQIWEDNNMSFDSTMGFNEKEGFRCGVCYGYSVFNILARKKLKVRECPLILQEASLISQQKATPEFMLEKTESLLDKVKKYRGDFVLLWHNHRFCDLSWDNTGPGWNDRKYLEVYTDILKVAMNRY